MTGSGKTYFVKKHLLRGQNRLVIFDPEEEFCNEPGFELIDDMDKLKAVLRQKWDSDFRIAFVPENQFEERDLSAVSHLIEQIQEPYKKGDRSKKIMLIIDELSLSFKNPFKEKYSGFARICSRGRKRGIDVIGISQRPANVSTDFRSSCDSIISFRLYQPTDLDAMRKVMGPQAESAIQQLPEYSHVIFKSGAFETVSPSKSE